MRARSAAVSDFLPDAGTIDSGYRPGSKFVETLARGTFGFLRFFRELAKLDAPWRSAVNCNAKGRIVSGRYEQ